MKRWAFCLAFLLLLASQAHAAQVMKWLLGTQATLLSTELNGLGNNAWTNPSTAYNNIVAGGGGDGYLFCDVEFTGTFAASPTANTGLSVWLLVSSDGGSTYENTPNATVTLGRAPDVVLPVTTGQTGTHVIRRIVCPWGFFKGILKNDNTGQPLTGSGHTLKIRPVTLEGISQ